MNCSAREIQFEGGEARINATTEEACLDPYLDD